MLSPRLTAACAAAASLVAGLSLASAYAANQDAPPWPTDAWTTASPESVDLNGASFAELDRDIGQGVYGNVDRMLVVRGGRLVVDAKYDRDYREISRGASGPLGCGEGCTDPAAMHDFNYYHPDFHPFYQGREVHSLQSVTKSIAATVVGIALGGEGLARPFLGFFEDRNLVDVDPRLRRSTLLDLLTMRSGIEWHEQDRPFDETNTTLQLEGADDWIQFTLDQPMDADPGTKWVYNSGGSHLMSGIVRAATGRFIDDYATEFLFGPLGIEEFYWKKTPQGYPDTEGGLYLRAEDLAKIGYLYLHDGVWDGERILPAGWVEQATTRHARAIQGNWDYGLQWWLTTRNGLDVWAGRGFGGQLLYVIPERDIVGVVNAWNIFGQRSRNVANPFLEALMR